MPWRLYVPVDATDAVIGEHGEVCRKIQKDSGVRLDIDKASAVIAASDQGSLITIHGTMWQKRTAGRKLVDALFESRGMDPNRWFIFSSRMSILLPADGLESISSNHMKASIEAIGAKMQIDPTTVGVAAPRILAHFEGNAQQVISGITRLNTSMQDCVDRFELKAENFLEPGRGEAAPLISDQVAAARKAPAAGIATQPVHSHPYLNSGAAPLYTSNSTDALQKRFGEQADVGSTQTSAAAAVVSAPPDPQTRPSSTSMKSQQPEVRSTPVQDSTKVSNSIASTLILTEPFLDGRPAVVSPQSSTVTAAPKPSLQPEPRTDTPAPANGWAHSPMGTPSQGSSVNGPPMPAWMQPGPMSPLWHQPQAQKFRLPLLLPMRMVSKLNQEGQLSQISARYGVMIDITDETCGEECLVALCGTTVANALATIHLQWCSHHTLAS